MVSGLMTICTTVLDVGPVGFGGIVHATSNAEAVTTALTHLVLNRISALVFNRISAPRGVRFGSSTGVARDRVR